MPKMQLDDLPISKIGWSLRDSMPSDYNMVEVGEDGVTKIDAVEQNLGEYGICWLQVWTDDVLVARYNARNVDSILY